MLSISLLAILVGGCAIVPQDCEPYFNTELYDQCVIDYKHDKALRRAEERESIRAYTNKCKAQGGIYTCSSRFNTPECGCVSKDVVRSELEKL